MAEKVTSTELANTGIMFSIEFDDEQLANLYGGAHVRGRIGLTYEFKFGDSGRSYCVVIAVDRFSVFDHKPVVIATSVRRSLQKEQSFYVRGKGPKQTIRVIVFESDEMLVDKVIEVR